MTVTCRRKAGYICMKNWLYFRTNFVISDDSKRILIAVAKALGTSASRCRNEANEPVTEIQIYSQKFKALWHLSANHWREEFRQGLYDVQTKCIRKQAINRLLTIHSMVTLNTTHLLRDSFPISMQRTTVKYGGSICRLQCHNAIFHN